MPDKVDVEVVLGAGRTGIATPESVTAPVSVQLKRLLSLAVGADKTVVPSEAEMIDLIIRDFAEENGGTVLTADVAKMLLASKISETAKDAEIDRLKKAVQAKGKGASKSPELAAYGTGVAGMKAVTDYILGPEGLGNMHYRFVVECSLDEKKWEPVANFNEKLARLGTKKDDKTGVTVQYPGMNKQQSVSLTAKNGTLIGASIFGQIVLHLPQKNPRWE